MYNIHYIESLSLTGLVFTAQLTNMKEINSKKSIVICQMLNYVIKLYSVGQQPK